MPVNRQDDDTPLPAGWTAAAVAVASLLALWPCRSLHQGLADGVGWVMLAIFAPIVFGVVCMLGTYPMIWLLKRQRSTGARWALCLVPAGLLLAINGLPGLIGMGSLLFMTVSAYIDTAHKIRDGRDLKSFLGGAKPIVNIPLVDTPIANHILDGTAIGKELISGPPKDDKPTGDKPRQVPVATNALRGFGMPLWERLQCESLAPLSITEGLEDGFHYTVLNLRHRAFGWQSDNGATVVTTFFVVNIPEAIKGRVVTWQPEGWDVSVDERCVYLARLQKQARPGEWRGLIQQAINVAETLKTRSEAGRQAGVRTYRHRAHGAALHMFNAWIFLVIGVAMAGYGLANMVNLLDYRTGCLRGSTEARCLDTKHGYSVPEALYVGGRMALIGGLLIWGAYHFRGQARRRRQSDAHQQADL